MALELLQGNPGVTAGQLAVQLGVSERAARRYVAILREADIPIESVRGPYGGYRIGRGLRLPPVLFSATEALGLVMAVLEGHHAAADPTEPVGSALAKILRGLPEPVAAQADAVRRAAAATPNRHPSRPDPGTTVTLVEAHAGRRQVRIGYRTDAGREWTVEVDPWAIVVRHGRWYLLCFDHRARAQRAYRIDRVTAVEVLDQTFDPPADLDPVAGLEEHLAVGWEYDVEVVVDASLDEVATYLPRAMGRLDVVDERTTRIVGTTSNPVLVVERLVVLPMTYRIVGGPEVRTAALQIAARLAGAAT